MFHVWCSLWVGFFGLDASHPDGAIWGVVGQAKGCYYTAVLRCDGLFDRCAFLRGADYIRAVTGSYMSVAQLVASRTLFLQLFCAPRCLCSCEALLFRVLCRVCSVRLQVFLQALGLCGCWGSAYIVLAVSCTC